MGLYHETKICQEKKIKYFVQKCKKNLCIKKCKSREKSIKKLENNRITLFFLQMNVVNKFFKLILKVGGDYDIIYYCISILNLVILLCI